MHKHCKPDKPGNLGFTACHKPIIWEWLLQLIHGDSGDGLLLGLAHLTTLLKNENVRYTMAMYHL